jgi:hypothetical protein
MINGIIFLLLRTYWCQNTKYLDLGLRPLFKSPILASLLARLGPESFETSVFCLKQALQESWGPSPYTR